MAQEQNRIVPRIASHQAPGERQESGSFVKKEQSSVVKPRNKKSSTVQRISQTKEKKNPKPLSVERVHIEPDRMQEPSSSLKARPGVAKQNPTKIKQQKFKQEMPKPKKSSVARVGKKSKKRESAL